MMKTQLVYVPLQPSGTLYFLIKKMLPVPDMRSLLGRYFLTPLGRSLPHLLALEQDHISAAGPLRIFKREGLLPDASWVGVTRT